jgi:hypothetical protein
MSEPPGPLARRRLNEMPSGDGGVTLTESQLHQLRDFLEEKDHSGSLALRPAATLGGGHIEAILLDGEGEETADKRILFPN